MKKQNIPQDDLVVMEEFPGIDGTPPAPPVPVENYFPLPEQAPPQGDISTLYPRDPHRMRHLNPRVAAYGNADVKGTNPE